MNTTINPAIKQALAQVIGEERKLTAEQDRIAGELEKLKEVRRMLEKQAGLSQRPPLAPPGALQGQIVGVLGRRPMSRAKVIQAIRRGGYEYSLTPLHVTKTLIRLVRAGKVKRVGRDSSTAYLKAS